jgi:beta-N-acetylhexosaminidase
MPQKRLHVDPREIGKLFVIGIHGTRVTPEIKELISDFNPSGVILFSRNIVDPIQIGAFNHDLQAYARQSLNNGLLIGVDQEGGRVRRLKEPFSCFPASSKMAGSEDPEATVRNFGTVTAQEIRSVGFNLDFIPVLDVISPTEDLDSSVIGDRSYGSDPETVSLLGCTAIDALRSGGVIPCCKHFPGHGGTSVDSHKKLPEDHRQAVLIERRDLVPFRKAVEMDVEMVMTAHVLYRSLDSLEPATLSRKVVDGMLRKGLGYDGVVITDDLEMGAVANRYSLDECAVRAFSAGVDLLLMCHDNSEAFAARQRIADAVKEGAIFFERVQESLRRVERLKSRYADSMRPCNLNEVRNLFGSRTNGGL